MFGGLFGSKYQDKKQLQKWAEEQANKGVPRQQIADELLQKKYIKDAPKGNIMDKKVKEEEKSWNKHNQACLDVEKSIMKEMMARNEKASKLEKAGKLDEAAELFEMSVKDKFSGTVPYDRLMMIYKKQKRYAEAIRVCEAYINNPYLSKGNKSGLGEYKDKLKKLKEEAAKAG